MKRMSASDVQNHWGEFVRSVTEEGQSVVVENRREPIFVAISPREFARFQALLREQRLQHARNALQEIERLQQGRNDDLSEDEIEAIGNEAAREIRDELERHLYGHPLSVSS